MTEIGWGTNPLPGIAQRRVPMCREEHVERKARMRERAGSGDAKHCRSRPKSLPSTHMPNLKAAHERFVQEYIANGRNGQDAYMVAFPKCGKRAARTLASRLLTRVEVKSRV